MSTLKQLRDGAGTLWDQLAEGWRHLSERASNALTRFTPGHHDIEGNEIERRIMRQSADWGFLAAEVLDDDKQVVVKLEAPGMMAENFDIHVSENVLVVRGEKRVEHQGQRGRYHVMERAYGAFERALQLPADVDENGTRAQYRHGVLTITMPKQAQPQSRRIEVKAG